MSQAGYNGFNDAKGDGMFLRIKSALLLASICLASCAPPTLYVATNSAMNERMKSARIVFGRPAEIQMVYEIYPGQPREVALKYATDNVERIIKAVQDNVPDQLSTALQKKGVSSGPDVVISLRPTSGWGSTNTTPRIQLEVSVQPGDRTKQPWIARISDGSFASSMNAEQTARIFTDRIMLELAKAGFVRE